MLQQCFLSAGGHKGLLPSQLLKEVKERRRRGNCSMTVGAVGGHRGGGTVCIGKQLRLYIITQTTRRLSCQNNIQVLDFRL